MRPTVYMPTLPSPDRRRVRPAFSSRFSHTVYVPHFAGGEIPSCLHGSSRSAPGAGALWAFDPPRATPSDSAPAACRS
jgi:hypothetical protein